MFGDLICESRIDLSAAESSGIRSTAAVNRVLRWLILGASTFYVAAISFSPQSGKDPGQAHRIILSRPAVGPERAVTPL
ncbi:hypothetical protein [Paracoccus sp. pheM1]|uniref:hypothetical protein n=1 Tax=Paracoccus sp. pheM1 TaxID=2831675 RepID=UPI001BDB8409|nr:hypothetical protein [Paracoccus sp. pheM1]MBT0781230.1 hypothetical protein [Paracoccus sp. pheM1]